MKLRWFICYFPKQDWNVHFGFEEEYVRHFAENVRPDVIVYVVEIDKDGVVTEL